MWFVSLGYEKNMASVWISPLGCLSLELILYVVRNPGHMERPHVNVLG